MLRLHRARSCAFAPALFDSSALALAGALLCASGCSGGGTGASGAGGFELEVVNVAPGQTWRINRPIEFTFSQPIDFGSISMNTVNIAASSGAPAVGEFLLDATRPRTVVFRPACPTRADLSDAGFAPGGTHYRIDLPTRASGASTVRSAEGDALATGLSLEFTTPVSSAPSELFLDTRPGPLSPLPGGRDESGGAIGTRLEPENGAPAIPFVPVDGVGVLVDPAAPSEELAVPLNFYSDVDARFRVIVEFDQALNPEAANVSSDRIRLEFFHAGTWKPFGTEVTLLANCTASGATVALRPLGVLPRERALRVAVTAELEDLVGDRNVIPLVSFATLHTRGLEDASGAPVDDFADEALETFVFGGAGSFEDTEVVLDTQRAQWGPQGLSAAGAFPGSGGPNGDFDWHLPPNSEVVLDTTSTLILGGPDGIPSTFQLVIGGVVDVRDLVVPATSRLRIQGPNPARFLCSGEVRIDGVIRVNGGNAQPVFTLNTPTQPEPGAAGNGGGGDGGVGSPITTAVTTRGGRGNGAFNALAAGGEGGESGWHPDGTGNPTSRRAAGGGGGTFGRDVVLPDGCFDQALVGLDAESGFPGTVEANAAERPGEMMPWGGMQATLRFEDASETGDEFFGVMRQGLDTPGERLLEGELTSPIPGSGGGAGGDATRATSYPPPTLIAFDTDKGAGGGGGAGALTIIALGDIVFGPSGRVEAIGGHGSGGENTINVNRVGGGSGGGSGGHVILETASQIDFSQVPLAASAIVARGGQGGAGANNQGGAAASEIPPSLDAKHVGSTGPGDTADNPWIPPVPAACQSGAAVIRGAGGDGGPGIVQLHVGTLPDDVLYPGGGDATALAGAVRPPPVGYDLASGGWVDQLLPSFGRFSKAQSDWIPLGVVTLAGESDVPQPMSFSFGGTDPQTGLLLRDGDALVPLEPLLAPSAPIEAEGLPSIDPDDPRTLWLDASELGGNDAIYRTNPELLRRFALRVGGVELEVETASHDAVADRLELRVSSAGPTIPGIGQVELVPRYFAIETDGVPGSYPANAEIRIELQAAAANAFGLPDAASIFPGDAAPETDGWARGADELEGPQSASYRFYRFRVTFDLAADGGELGASTPLPKLEFLRLPFRF